MATNGFTKAVKETIIASCESHTGMEFIGKSFKILAITFRECVSGHSKYDVLVKHKKQERSECDISAFEVVLDPKGRMWAYYNGSGWTFKRADGSIYFGNDCISYGSFTREMANAWLKAVENELNSAKA